MCAMCQGATYERVVDDLARTVAEYGWVVRAVHGAGARPPWAYTVGLHGSGLPELVVTGMPTDPAYDLLNDVAEHLLQADEESVPGRQLTVAGHGPLEVVELPHPDVHLVHAVALYGPAFRAVQLVWPDERGRRPWEQDFRSSWAGVPGGQPVLGPRTAGPGEREGP